MSRQDDCVVQDGVVCPKIAPWGRYAGTITTIPYIFIAGFAVFILAGTSITALVIWLLLLCIFAIPLRYLICARCPYYGQPCSTVSGMLTPKLFKKQEGRSMILGLWLDVVFFLILFFFPLPYAWLGFGWSITLLWIMVIMSGFLIHTRFGCARCPFTFCPIGKVARVLWNVKDNRGCLPDNSFPV